MCGITIQLHHVGDPTRPVHKVHSDLSRCPERSPGRLCLECKDDRNEYEPGPRFHSPRCQFARQNCLPCDTPAWWVMDTSDPVCPVCLMHDYHANDPDGKFGDKVRTPHASSNFLNLTM
jgi:hypothetical protein